MAFRRSFRRFSAPRKRRSNFTRFITETRKWEAANFYFSETMAATALSFDLVAWDLMNVAHFSGFGTDPRQLSDAIRSVDIGGVVWDTMLMNPLATTTATRLTFTEVLATDRLLTNDQPASLPSLDWTLTSSPVSGSATGAVDGDFPVRIHKRRTYGQFVLTSAGGSNTGYQASYPATFSNTWSTQRCRIKGALGDRQGLFLFHQLNARQDNSGVSLFAEVSGTLYYRVRY